jgi:hypothetical protein
LESDYRRKAMIECEVKIIKKPNMLIITTDDKYDSLNEEYFKIPNEIIRTIYSFFTTKFDIVEFSEINYDDVNKVKDGKIIALKQSISTKLINRMIKGVTQDVVFKKFESSKFNNEYLEELHLVGDTNGNGIFTQLATITATRIEELTEQLILRFPFVMTIFDSSSINIYCKNVSYLEVLLDSFTTLEKYII